jgi:hypothetical protein
MWVYRHLSNGKDMVVSAVVKSEDGELLEGVEIGYSSSKNFSGAVVRYQTGPKGRFSYTMRVGPNGRRLTNVKALSFSKDGYVSKKIVLHPLEPLCEVRQKKSGT